MEGEPTEALKSPATSVPALPPQYFFPVLVKATEDFDRRFYIHEDSYSYSSVFMGTLHTGQAVAIKRLNDCNENVFRENFRQQHPNLINLLGDYTICKERYLIFEYISSDLESRLHHARRVPEMEPLTWTMRMKIAAGVAKALSYLHNIAVPSVIYGDLKSYNVLLPESLDPKLFDAFMHNEVEASSMYRRGYRAPECIAGQATFESDVYSFGILLLELITGQKVVDAARGKNKELLVDWVQEKMTRWEFDKIIDPILEKCSSLMSALKIAMSCTEQVERRPTMKEVIRYVDNSVFEGPDVLNFSYHELASATDQFTKPIFVGETCGFANNFGTVTKGTLLESEGEGKQREIAVYVDGIPLESRKDIYLRFALRHQNIVGLVGYCLDLPFIATEFEPPQRSLASHIHLNAAYGDENYLDWTKRMRIALEVAQAMDYMHNVAIPPVVCGEVTSSCILVGLEAKLCMYRSLVEKNFWAYSAPELRRSDRRTFISDIYSYGVLLLELITGRKGFDERYRKNEVLVKWAKVQLQGDKKPAGILDCHLVLPSFKCDQALERAASLALRCVDDNIEERPSIKEIIKEMRFLEEITAHEIEKKEEKEDEVIKEMKIVEEITGQEIDKKEEVIKEMKMVEETTDQEIKKPEKDEEEEEAECWIVL